MEKEIIQTVLSEVLQELQEVKKQQIKIQEVIEEIRDKIEGFNEQSSGMKSSPESIDFKHIMLSISNCLHQIKSTIEAQPKAITRQFRVLLFPEENAIQYYKVVFRRLLFWMTLFLIATYAFVIGKEFTQGYIKVKQTEAEAVQYKKAWDYLYENSKKGLRKKMDSVWSRGT